MLEELQIDPLHYSLYDLEKIYHWLHTLLSNLGNQSISIKKYETDYAITLATTNASINNTLDEFYFQKEQQSAFISSRNNLLRIVSRKFKKSIQKTPKYPRKITRM